MPPGRQRDNVRVFTNIEEMPSVDIQLACWVVRKLSLSHEELNFRYRQQLNQNVRLTPFVEGIEYRITGAEIDLPEIQLEIDHTIPNKEAIVRVTGTPISKDDPGPSRTRAASRALSRSSPTCLIWRSSRFPCRT
jgi:hypothetical protein